MAADSASSHTVASPQVARHRVVRAWWLVIGFASVGTGVVGIVVPGLPTTVFFIIAAWCFGRSSPRFEQWVLDLPRVGPMVADHRAGLGMTQRSKRIAIATMWIAILLSAWLARERHVVVAVVGVAGFIGTLYILWRVPTREKVLARQANNNG